MPNGPYEGLATTFDTAAELYERARPGYPPELFEDLAALGGLETGSAHVLEIGPGTGQATRSLLARGWRVVALEPGKELAIVAARVLAGSGDVEIVVTPFERWRGREGSFDLVFAATSFHWLDPSVAYQKAAKVLRPGGCLAIVATEHVLPEVGGDAFFREVQQAYAAVAMSDGLGGPLRPDEVPPPNAAEIRASGLFEAPVVRRYISELSYSAEEYVALLGTYSGHIAASPERQARLFADIRGRIQGRPGGTVRKHYLHILQTARRAG